MIQMNKYLLLPLILLVSLVVFANPATHTGITIDTNISEMASDIRFLKEQVQSLQSENEALKIELSEVQVDVSESRPLDTSVVHILNGVNTLISNQEKENAKTAIAVESLNEWNWFKDLPVILALIANIALVVVTRRSVENSIKTSEDQAEQNKKLLDQNATQLDKLERQLCQNETQIKIAEKEYTNKYLVSLLVEIDETKLRFSEEQIDGRPKYLIFDDNHINLSNLSNYPAYRLLLYTRSVNKLPATLLDFDEEVSWSGGLASIQQMLLGQQALKPKVYGFKIETKKQNVEKYFIDYQISYYDLHGTEYTALYTYYIVTVKSSKKNEIGVSQFRFIIDGKDVAPGRRKLIMSLDAVFNNPFKHSDS